MRPSVQTEHQNPEDSTNEWVNRLLEAAKTGRVLDLAPSQSDQELSAADPSSWPDEQRIPATAIRSALLRESLLVDPKGLQIRGCYVTGSLDLDYANLRYRLGIRHSHFADTPTFVHATASEIDFSQSTVPGLNLEFSKVTGNVVLTGVVSTGRIFAKNAHIGGQFNLGNAKITAAGDALALQGAVVRGSVLLPRLRISGRISAINSVLGARLVLSGACVGESEGYSILLKNSSVAGNVHMDYLDLSGTLHAYGTHFGADFVMEFATIRSFTSDALVLDNATIAKNAIVRDSIMHGALRAHSIGIGGQLELERTKISSSTSPLGILLTHASVNTGARLQGIHLRGRLEAYGAKFGGDLLLDGCDLAAPQSRVLVLDRATVGGTARLASSHHQGTFSAIGANFKGDLILSKSEFASPALTTDDSYAAVLLSLAQVAGITDLTHCNVEGGIVASGAHFSGLLDLSDTTIRNKEGIALHLGLVKVGLEGRFVGLKTEGTVSLYGAQFERNLTFSEAEVYSPYSFANCHSAARVSEVEDEGYNDDALVLTRIDVGGSLNLTSATFGGALIGINSRVGSQLHLEDARIANPERVAINFSHARVGNLAGLSGLSVDGDFIGSGWIVTDSLELSGVDVQDMDLGSSSIGQLLLTDTARFRGPIRLHGSSIGVLEVEARKPTHALPPLADARGWKVGTVHGYLGADRHALKEWLVTIPSGTDVRGRESFAPQPWKELARSLETMGRSEDARWLRYKAAERTTQTSSPLAKSWRLLLARSVGYGYYSWFVVPWLITLFIATMLLAGAFADDFTPVDTRAATRTHDSSQGQVTERVSGTTFPRPQNYPEFNAALFAVDTALPAAVTGQSAAWRVTENQWLPAVFAAIKAFAWILTALLLAGVTGVLRKE